MAMLQSGMSIKLPVAEFDKELHVQHSGEFAFQSRVWNSQGELPGAL